MTCSKFFRFAAAIILVAITSIGHGHAHAQTPDKPVIVLVHGSFADGTGWQKVIRGLQHDGYTVVAAQPPLTSLADDVEVVKRVINAQSRPVIAVGHSYGGAVITAAAFESPKVRALVYIAAFAPDDGETIGAFGAQYPTELGTALIKDSAGYLSINPRSFHKLFAADVPVNEANIMAAAQKPIVGDVFTASIRRAAWKNIPAWYVVTRQDMAISPDLQRFYAKRMGATTVEVNSSHVPMVSQPREMIRVIERAATAGVASKAKSAEERASSLDLNAAVPTRFVDAGGNRISYRSFGTDKGIPLVFLQHFTGTMDNWDPILTNRLAESRRVILFDNVGVGRSTGSTPESVAAMARDAVLFIQALGLQKVDLLGFSLGGFVAQEIATQRPVLVRRVVLAGTGPQGGQKMEQGLGLKRATLSSVYSPTVVDILTRDGLTADERLLGIFFAKTKSSQEAGRGWLSRIAARKQDREPAASDSAVASQLQAIQDWGVGNGARAAYLNKITQPALVVNGGLDIMVPTANSYLLQQELPNARLVLYPDSGHAAIFQYANDFANEVDRFLTTAR